mmetsp:Transcript_20546/g.43426  ORF Transcript_20546/g.43426 Transcript_20546/m.43426 type:complete len:89 (+) Transcript_20546:294-560(+)
MSCLLEEPSPGQLVSAEDMFRGNLYVVQDHDVRHLQLSTLPLILIISFQFHVGSLRASALAGAVKVHVEPVSIGLLLPHARLLRRLDI